MTIGELKQKIQDSGVPDSAKIIADLFLEPSDKVDDLEIIYSPGDEDVAFEQV